MKINPIQFLPGTIWVIIIFVLLVMPGSDIPSNDFFELVYFDKWVHIGLFSTLTFLWAYPFLKLEFSTLKAIITVAVIATVYGIIMEFVQKYFAVNRSFDVTDILADAAGATFGILILMKIRKIRKT